MDSVKTTVDLLRHGEVNGAPCYRGMMDTLLSGDGWQQMQRATALYNWDYIVSSPLQRCASFAQTLAQQKGVVLDILPCWQEMDFGDWEGQNSNALLKNDQQHFMAWLNDPLSYPPPNGESLLAVQRRIMRAWQRLLQQHSGQRILIITHDAMIRVVMSCLLGTSLTKWQQFRIAPAHFARFGVYRKKEGCVYTVLEGFGLNKPPC